MLSELEIWVPASEKRIWRQTSYIRPQIERRNLRCLGFKLAQVPGSIVSTIRGVTRSDWSQGGKKQVSPPCLNLRFFGSKCIVLIKCLWYFWDFPAPPHPSDPAPPTQVIRRPHSDWAPGELCSSCTPVVTLLSATRTRRSDVQSNVCIKMIGSEVERKTGHGRLPIDGQNAWPRLGISHKWEFLQR